MNTGQQIIVVPHCEYWSANNCTFTVNTGQQIIVMPHCEQWSANNLLTHCEQCSALYLYTMNTGQEIIVAPHYEHWLPGHYTSTLWMLVSKSLYLLTVNIGEWVITFHTLNTGELVRIHQYCRDVKNAVYVVMYNIFIGNIIILHEAQL